ncbi:MAG: hypothetical protein P1U77_17970 [Rubripirellula sp.]|nr:hypothetical protein [Rubripirellula sp.]
MLTAKGNPPFRRCETQATNAESLASKPLWRCFDPAVVGGPAWLGDRREWGTGVIGGPA